MKRLTERSDDKCKDCEEIYKSRCIECSKSSILYDRLAEYEDAEEDGRIIRLPVSIGGNFYEIFLRKDGWTDIVEWKVDGYSLCNNALYIHTIETDIYFNCEHFGETLFSTKEEAEAKLKEMEEDSHDNS